MKRKTEQQLSSPSHCTQYPSSSIFHPGLYIRIFFFFCTTLFLLTWPTLQPIHTRPAPPRMYPKEEYEDIPYSDTKAPSIVKGPSHAHTRRSIAFRVLTFISLELAFIAFAWTAHQKQGIDLHIRVKEPATRNLAQSIFTWLVITWNTIAINALKDVVLYVFSAEWLSQSHNMDYALVTGTADRVSVLTSGLVDQIVHFISGAATARYKVSLMMLLLLLSSKGFAPATISLDTGFVNVTRRLDVANVTFGDHNTTGEGLDQGMSMILGRSASFMRSEQLEKITYEYKTQEKVLIPWPRHVKMGAKYWYTSDVMSYDFSCNWTTPTAPPQRVGSLHGLVWEAELQGTKTQLRTLEAYDTPCTCSFNV